MTSDKTRTDEVIKSYYDKHPEEARKIGSQLLSEMKKENQEKAALYDLAAGRGGFGNPLQNQYRGKFLWHAGMGWTQWIVLTAALYFVADLLDLPRLAWLLLSLALSVYIIWKKVR